MRFRYLFAVLSLLVFVPVMAQMTFDGKRPVYDKLTDTYLLTLPESTFGHPYSAVPVIDDTVSWVNLAGKMVRQTADFPIVKGDTVYQMMYAHNGRLTKPGCASLIFPSCVWRALSIPSIQWATWI